jgi:hypothetical protein
VTVRAVRLWRARRSAFLAIWWWTAGVVAEALGDTAMSLVVSLVAVAAPPITGAKHPPRDGPAGLQCLRACTIQGCGHLVATFRHRPWCARTACRYSAWLRGFREADAGTRTPDPIITSNERRGHAAHG